MSSGGVIGKGKSPALQARSLRPIWFPKESLTPPFKILFFRDPSSFVAGELSNHESYWVFILSQHPKKMRFYFTSSTESRFPIFLFPLGTTSK